MIKSIKVVTQKEKHNKDQVQRAIQYGKEQRQKPHQANQEAATVMGEFIARKNNYKSTTLEEVIDYYKPSFAEKRKET